MQAWSFLDAFRVLLIIPLILKKILLDGNVTLEEHLQEILPPAPQPPMEAFPQKIQKMLFEVAKALVVPLPVVIATFLATLSCCIGRSQAIRIKKDG